jgi:hypothetical protein
MAPGVLLELYHGAFLCQKNKLHLLFNSFIQHKAVSKTKNPPRIIVRSDFFYQIVEKSVEVLNLSKFLSIFFLHLFISNNINGNKVSALWKKVMRSKWKG